MRLLIAALLAAALTAGCGGSGSKSSSPTTVTTVATGSSADSSSETTSSLAVGAQAGLDDYNGHGQPEAPCGTPDHGAGLVGRRWCHPAAPAGHSAPPPAG